MNYILFSSDDKVVIYTFCSWNGIIEYSYDNIEWKQWAGMKIANERIYMRGINNTIISDGNKWIIQGKNVKCQGNIENLLDYTLVKQNIHPKMDDRCFACMFRHCVSLIEAPELPATELAEECYKDMFMCCTSLKKAPKVLPAMTLFCCCYNAMFYGCHSLINPSEIFAIKLAPYCCTSMFEHCKSLRKMPQLLAISLDIECYKYMFYGCSRLIEVSELPAMNLAEDCYEGMFMGCRGLIGTPQFSNMIIAKQALEQNMFTHCSLLQYININNKQYDINILKLF